MSRKDVSGVVIIGLAVGLLIQPILANTPLASHLSLVVRVGVVLFFALFALCALWIAYLLSRFWKVLYQFAKFCAVGSLNTFVDLGVFNLEILAFGTPGLWSYRILKAVSFFAGTTNSFLWNKFWTFHSETPASPSETIKFYSVAFVGFFLNVGLASYVFSSVVRPASITPNLWANVGALVGVAGAFLWDFLGYKYLVFKERK